MSRHSKSGNSWLACAVCLPAVLGVRNVQAQSQPQTQSQSATNDGDTFKFSLADRYLYDDNLFRIPDGLLESNPDIVPPNSRKDYVNRATAAMRMRLDASRQVLIADLRIEDVRYRRNDELDHVAGAADVNWDFELGSRLAGKATVQYEREQASLANYRFFGKDIVDALAYGGELSYAIGSRWHVLAGTAAANTRHSAFERRFENFDSTTGRGGIEYRTPAGNVLGADYRYTDAKFPRSQILLAGVKRGYSEYEPSLRVEYGFTEQTRLKIRAGYLKRDYNNAELNAYSGSTADATLHWEPRTQLEFDLRAWHLLKAYVDSESEYFVGDGVSLTPTWSPTRKLKVAAMYSYEDQDYVGRGLLELPTDIARNDSVNSAMFSIDYTPRDLVTVQLSYRWTDRASNREFRDYGDNMASLQIKLNL